MLDNKYSELNKKIENYGSVAVAFSGGVDSTFLLKVAHEVLGENVLAITASSPLIPRNEVEGAKDFCKRNNIRQITFTYEIENEPQIRLNPKDRCYHCKKSIFKKMKDIALENGMEVLLDGSNEDDTKDYRPGMKALEELEIVSPLKDAGLTKQDIRELSKKMGLPTWNKPSYACLATRIPFGAEITIEKLSMIEKAEEVLHENGFLRSRVRLHGNLARIEVSPEQFDEIMKPDIRGVIVKELRKIGFNYVSLDMQGYRMGSMNEYD